MNYIQNRKKLIQDNGGVTFLESKTKVSQQMLYSWLRGDRDLHLKTLTRLLDYLVKQKKIPKDYNAIGLFSDEYKKKCFRYITSQHKNS